MKKLPNKEGLVMSKNAKKNKKNPDSQKKKYQL